MICTLMGTVHVVSVYQVGPTHRGGEAHRCTNNLPGARNATGTKGRVHGFVVAPFQGFGLKCHQARPQASEYLSHRLTEKVAARNVGPAPSRPPISHQGLPPNL